MGVGAGCGCWVRSGVGQCDHFLAECDLFWLGVGECGREFMSLSQKYEERVQKFSFLAQHHFKAELYC